MTNPVNRRDEILKIARNLFLNKYYDKTTMVDIMDALEIAKGTIYDYFKSKEALFEAVIKFRTDPLLEKFLGITQSSYQT